MPNYDLYTASSAVSDELHAAIQQAWTELKNTGSYSTATVTTYANNIARFVKWCEKAGVTAVPASNETFDEYSAYCISTTESNSTYQAWIMGVDRLHWLADLPKPVLSRSAKWQRRGARRSGGLKAPKQARPLIGEDLGVIADKIDPECYLDRVVLAATMVMADSGIRVSECVSLRWDDTKVQNDGTVGIYLAKSKTDQFAVGSYRDISAATAKYLSDMYLSFGIRDPEFLINKMRSRGGTWGFTPATMRTYFMDFREKYGVDMSSHSPRGGFVVEALQVGIPDASIASYMGCSVANVSRYGRHTLKQVNAGRKLRDIRAASKMLNV